MFKKFNIEHFAVFNDFDWDASVQNASSITEYLCDINIIYGRNYSGKTSLSRIVRSLETNQLPEKYHNSRFKIFFHDGTTITENHIDSCSSCVRVFNEDFVRDHLRFLVDPDGDGKIKPIAILGDDNTRIEEEIKKITLDLGDSEDGKESGLYAKIKADLKSYNTAKQHYDAKVRGLDLKLAAKATGRDVGIKYRSDKFGDQNYNITKLKNDIETVFSPQYEKPDNECLQTLEKIIQEESRPSVILEDCNISWDALLEKAQELVLKEIGNSNKITELLLNEALNEWVRQGCKLHDNESNTCAFCGAKISESRWDAIKCHFDDESTRLEVDIDSLFDHIESEKKTIDGWLTRFNRLDVYASFQQERNKHYKALDDLFSIYFSELDKISAQIKKRKSNIVVSFAISLPGSDFYNNISTIKSALNACKELIAKSNQFTTDLSAQQMAAKRKLCLNEVYEFCVEIDYRHECDEIEKSRIITDKLQVQCNKTKADVSNKTLLLEDKKKELNDEGKGAELINRYLSGHFGHQFLRLEAVSDNGAEEKNTRFEIWRDGKRAHNLSVGERNLIAFCYFLAKLDDSVTKGSKPIIWIDDPASSLDSNHIFFIYSIIASQIVKSGDFSQLFISTHCLNFLKYLFRIGGLSPKKIGTNGKPQQKECRYLLLHRTSEESLIKLMPKYMRNYVTEFNYLFHEIYKCSTITEVDDSNYSSMYNFGNNARKFLELYLYYKYPDHNLSEDARMMKFFGSNDDVPAILVDRLDNEYSHLCGTLERGGLPVDKEEIKKVAQLICDKIEKKDTDQYIALLTSINALPAA